MFCQRCAIVLVSLAVGINFSSAIQCDFKYVSDDNDHQSVEVPTTLPATVKTRSTMKARGIFNCEDPLDEYEPITDSFVNSRAKPMGFDTRFGEDEYESAASDCTSSKKTIQPKALNNVYNKLTKVVNTASFIQSINIEQCLSKKEQCNSGTVPPLGKKHICRQKHVPITLKALKEGDEGNVIIDEQFYYPSHCVCELVTVKKRKHVSVTSTSRLAAEKAATSPLKEKILNRSLGNATRSPRPATSAAASKDLKSTSVALPKAAQSLSAVGAKKPSSAVKKSPISTTTHSSTVTKKSPTKVSAIKKTTTTTTVVSKKVVNGDVVSEQTTTTTTSGDPQLIEDILKDGLASELNGHINGNGITDHGKGDNVQMVIDAALNQE